MTTIASSSPVTKPLVPAFRPLQEALAPYAGRKSIDALIGWEI